MKLEIDIDEDYYKIICKRVKENKPYHSSYEYEVIADGKPLEQETKTGHWIVEKGGSYLGQRNACCSNCKDFYTNDWNVMNYCPNCGANMREVEE